MAANKQAVILVNLGTPADATPAAVRQFLKPFLSDSRVVEVPRPIWYLILNCFILPFRPKAVAKVYRSLWDKYGDSPLRLITQEQVQNLAVALGENYEVRYAMTYGAPGLAEVIDELKTQDFSRIAILPLYPQYSGSTTGAVWDQLADYVKSQRHVPNLSLIPAYADHPLFIEALAQSVRQFWRDNGQGDFLLMSYHGIPQAYVDKGDPYSEHCEMTSRLLASDLDLDSQRWQMSYQSRLGRAKWLQPYTEATVIALAKRGVKKLDVICPAFSADCIETIDEIGRENAEVFYEHGGQSLRLVPCLNANPDHIRMMQELLNR